MNEVRKLRSADWFGRKDKLGFIHRSWMRTEGFSSAVFQNKPVIGIDARSSDFGKVKSSE